MEAISRSCLPAAAARTKRQRKATCCGVLGAASHRTTCARSSADKLTSGLILAMHTYISYWPQYVYLFMIHTTSGSALAVNWAQDHAAAILEAWYPGEEGGAAVADVLSGDYNPAGRLPVTFYKSVAQLPPFGSYSMNGRTYRYLTEQPLYPFGYGLSFSSFNYSDAKVTPDQVAVGTAVTVSARVTNASSVPGDEVVELYLSHPGVDGAPLRALAGFQRIHLAISASQTVTFRLNDRDLSTVDEAGIRRVVPGPVEVWIGGGQPAAAGQPATKGVSAKFNITSGATLDD